MRPRMISLLMLTTIATAWTTPTAGQDVTVRLANPADEPLRAYDRVEWIVDAGRDYDNPFDPDEVAVDAALVGPDGAELVLPVFWYRAAPNAAPQWRLRFAPPRPGAWTLRVTVTDATGARYSPAAAFQVEPSSHPGFVRRVSNDSRYFHFDSGKPYFMVGLNLAWPKHDGLNDYRRWFGILRGVGGNFARIWITDPRTLETVETGIGRYDQDVCAYFDAVLELAEAHDIRVMLTLNHYRELIDRDVWGDAFWPTSPYNAANGGPAKTPLEFFDGPASGLYKQRLRYIVARYAAYSSIAFWELWNEQDHLPEPGVPTAWIAEMSAYLRQIDPYDRPITTSYSWQDRAEVWRLPTIDLTQRHLYGDGGRETFASAVAEPMGKYDAYGKPHLIGEFGISWKEPDAKLDTVGSGVELHNAMWASMMSGAAGTAMTWWWNNYIEPKNLWRLFVGVSRFADSVAWADRRFEPLGGVGLDRADLLPFALQDEASAHTLLWLLDRASTWTNDVAGVTPTSHQGVWVMVPMPGQPSTNGGTRAGEVRDFIVEWWNTRAGEVIQRDRVTVREGEIRLQAPAFSRDIAVKLTPATD